MIWKSSPAEDGPAASCGPLAVRQSARPDVLCSPFPGLVLLAGRGLSRGCLRLLLPLWVQPLSGERPHSGECPRQRDVPSRGRCGNAESRVLPPSPGWYPILQTFADRFCTRPLLDTGVKGRPKRVRPAPALEGEVGDTEIEDDDNS